MSFGVFSSCPTFCFRRTSPAKIRILVRVGTKKDGRISGMLEETRTDSGQYLKVKRSSLRHRSFKLKITNFEVYQLGELSQGSATWAGNSILLKLTTSDGTIGYGEAVPTLRVQPVIQSLHEVARVFKGKDPLDMELNIHEWHKHDFYP